MKLKNKNGLVIAGLTSVVGASLIGSIAGTVAWYQYSTRATASYLGESASCTENLLVKKFDGSYATDLRDADVKALHTDGYSAGDTIVPVTAGGVAKNAALGDIYEGAAYQNFGGNGAVANHNRYVKFDLNFHVNDGSSTSSTAAYLEKDLYLTDLTIQQKATNGKKDISNALRVQFSCGDTNMLFSKADASLNTYGNLDLNRDGEPDKDDRYGFNPTAQAGVYGVAGSTQTTYLTDRSDNAKVLASEENSILTATAINGVTPLGKTKTSEDLTVTVTIWLEGWEKFEGAATADWSETDYLGAQFQIGMSFGVTPNE